ncbi:tripartite tricarboxylate transporter substrate binding protein [Rhodoferax sp. BAB1]|uniref:Bug family tripartite tricarboxylate transporter substrate binding protein n=1 Tax=Rhodoferax sp. BAB1 TaxID=2741720 RepID=UPI001576E6F7|nr:tripartite tricarboxylate transporter substrate binding protein [Rhodoferax sp. BAB1]QKO21266.1 tripartite tricarboxylate transporter substrate binding protein [Rhodoferax sp. BAB1]
MQYKSMLMAALLALGGTTPVWAQAAYPSKPIRLVVGFAPGGAADYVARSVGDALGRALGQPIVIENKAGAGSSIAADMVAKSAPDGYTLLIASPSSISVNPALNPKLNYKPNDLLPVTKLTASPLVIAVNPNAGLNSVKELIAKAKANPGALNVATAGNGSATHLGAAQFAQVAGVKFTEIPYRGGGPAMQSLIAGDTQIYFGTPPSTLPHIQSGRVRGLGISATERSALFPDLPGMKDAGLPEYELDFWYGFFVPAGTPPAIVQKLFEATKTAMQQESVKAALAREGTEVSLSQSPADYAAFLARDEKFWVKLVKDAGVKLD